MCWAALILISTFSLQLFAQDIPQVPPPDAAAIESAAQARDWRLLGALVVLGLVYISKPIGLWDKIPSKYRPIVVACVGLLVGVAQAIVTHQSWLTSLINGLTAAAIAVFADQIRSKFTKPKDTTGAAP
jgi:hypothetical protein